MLKDKIKEEKAFLVGVVLRGGGHINIEEQLVELEALANTAGALTVGSSIQKRQKPDSSTFIGKGKVETIINQAKELDLHLIIFNDELSPTQLKNIQKRAGDSIKIMDIAHNLREVYSMFV